jgi:hypothetical protein
MSVLWSGNREIPLGYSEELKSSSLNGIEAFHPTFHFPRDTRGRHATPRDSMWLMFLNFPNGVPG